MNYYEKNFAAAPPAPDGKKKAPHRRIIWGIFLVLLLVMLASILIPGVRRLTGHTGTLFPQEHIAVLSISGAIENTGSVGLFETAGYNHTFTLDAIDRLIEDASNRALIVYVDSPGGGVYETDEVYMQLMRYKEETGRPIYASFASMAASGGYYLAMAADWIYANRNCTTGSIGVRLGTMTDMSGLMEKLGIRTETITTGRNKAMGDSYSPMTGEQRQIYQDYVDEFFEQFLSIVVEGRPNLTEEQVRVLADGRIYTARQALANGLVDEIGTLDDAIQSLRDDYGLEDAAVRHITKTTSLWEELLASLGAWKPLTQAQGIQQVLEGVQAYSGYYCVQLLG